MDHGFPLTASYFGDDIFDIDGTKSAFWTCTLAEPWVGTVLEDDTWPYEDTEADDPIVAGIDTQMTSDGYVRINIAGSSVAMSCSRLRASIPAQR
ncbi:hypothetical protein [Rhizobium leguminosarum]|uniref:hypothetical protein n=1 Tax=Rhizobium leguminosarum TaxID=384 RepID=UPI0013BADBC6|nr:hypothetical protein [Rhizobium leguminosarum]MBY5325256.1 hypothetical protein [Rhizobium leguminosarum]MBY5381440.1 hypothetical protein [Rhizobium leguminosarum]MCA2432812.1 hypothetical protein [Rhizobium leguminosarum]NEH74724.1 hypothetical protein [Rhizobium leguminosarum]